MKYLKLLTIFFSGIFLFSACSSDDTNIEDDNVITSDSIKKEYNFLDSRSYTDWVYFSFEKGEIVSISNPETDLTWDIAFHRGDIKLNGGLSGTGKGEGLNTKITDWDQVTQAPTTDYKKDAIGKIVTSYSGGKITEEDQSFSQELTTWLEVDTSNPPPKYTVNKWIYVVKSAQGNYVKIQFLDNKNEKNAAGYVSFKYQYNKNTSDKF